VGDESYVGTARLGLPAALTDDDPLAPCGERGGDDPIGVQHHHRFVGSGTCRDDSPIRAPQHAEAGNRRSRRRHVSRLANVCSTIKGALCCPRQNRSTEP
jgi:hypothetical protein